MSGISQQVKTRPTANAGLDTRRLNLAELNPVPADFHLGVRAADEVERLSAPHPKVTRTVQAGRIAAPHLLSSTSATFE